MKALGVLFIMTLFVFPSAVYADEIKTSVTVIAPEESSGEPAPQVAGETTDNSTALNVQNPDGEAPTIDVVAESKPEQIESTQASTSDGSVPLIAVAVSGTAGVLLLYWMWNNFRTK
jgi:hypothetical protein